MEKVKVTKIENMIFIIRGHNVMMDSDLADLYEVPIRDLTRQVKRNNSRFPEDFLIIPDSKELEDLRCQFGTANRANAWNHMRRSTPMFFTENGIAMLSSVVSSERSIQINIAIIRVFTHLRSFLSLENSNAQKINVLEKNTTKLFKVVFEKMNTIEDLITPKISEKRKKIGLKVN
jgi:hypothetical protein